MPPSREADTIRILVATDNHVGYNETDPVRGDDSWQTFDEIMCLARERDVDMVLLAGDLFHDNKPSRKAMYEVMRSIRANCLGMKPCELELLSDASEHFPGTFDHVNYEDPDINISIPIFSIHGNHDDPSGESSLAALDLLQVSGLINYYGRTPESDNISVKPILLQKGTTKLALYGMSNVRDERLFRTFRDGHVKFYQPKAYKGDWFNLMSVHQNHFAHTETGYLPESFLPGFMDLVIWGHEHECVIDPTYNAEMSFHVMQPGSSVATSLMPGEAVSKHVAILSITDREFKSEAIRLKSVRPFVMRDVILKDADELKNKAKKSDNRAAITRYLETIVNTMIEEANQQWRELNENLSADEDPEPPPLPLIRLRVEYTAPEGGHFNCENPQRFSSRFAKRVANVTDVVTYYRKKVAGSRTIKDKTDMPEESVLAQMNNETTKVEKLIREYLSAQHLQMLPLNLFGDALSEFVDKDDNKAVERFLSDSLDEAVKHVLEANPDTEEEIRTEMEVFQTVMEARSNTNLSTKNGRSSKVKSKPDQRDTEEDSDSDIQEVAQFHERGERNAKLADVVASRARGTAATATTRASPVKVASTETSVRTGNHVIKPFLIEDDEDESDVIMLDDDDNYDDYDDDNDDLFVKPTRSATKKAPVQVPTVKPSTKKPPAKKPPAKKAPTKPTTSKAKQSKLDFSQPSQVSSRQTRNADGNRKALREPSDDEISDDAFEPVAASSRPGRARR